MSLKKNEHLTFTSNMWGDIEKIYDKIEKELNLIKNIYFIFTELQTIEDDYSIGLKRIVSYLNIENLDENSIIKSIIKMKNIFNLKSKYHENISILLQNSLCPNLLQILESIPENIESKKGKVKIFKSLYEASKQDLYYENLEYTNVAMDYVEKVIKYLNSINDEKSEIPSLVEKYLKGNEILNRIEISKQRYINSINNYNKSVEEYYQFNTNTLNEYQIFEDNFLSSLTLTLEELSHILNLDLDNISKEINDFVTLSKNINYKEDIQNYIKLNSSNIEIPKHANFIPFSTQYEDYTPFKNAKLKLKKHYFDDLSKCINKNFGYFSPLLNSENEETRNLFNTIENYTEKAYSGIFDKKNIDKLFIPLIQGKDNKKNKNYFLGILNKLRVQIKVLSSKGFDNIERLFRVILDDSLKYQNYDNIDLLIILSQTFYKSDNLSPNITLQERIKSHPIFLNRKTWEYLIEDHIWKGINYNKNNDNNKNNNIKDINSIDEKTLKNSVFSSLITYKFNMDSFNYDKRFMNSIIHEFLKKYNMEDENKILIEEIPDDGQFEVTNIDLINFQDYFNKNDNNNNDINTNNK